MRNTAHRRAAETLANVMRPNEDGTASDYGPMLHALRELDAKTLDQMRSEVVSLMAAGYPQQAAERLRAFLRPKFSSVEACREAYAAAMVGRAA